MRPHDPIIALALHALTRQGSPPTHASLSGLLSLSTSQIHRSIVRLETARLLDAQRLVRPAALHAFLVSAAPLVFPATVGGPSQGVPTGAIVFRDAGGRLPSELPEPTPLGWVWPSAAGPARGLTVEPLHPLVLGLAGQGESAALYRAVAAIDLLRTGDARSAAFAARTLKEFLNLEVRDGATVAVRLPEALGQVFRPDRLQQTIRKWLGEPRTHETAHPLEAPILDQLGPQLAERLAALVPTYRWRAQEGIHVELAKDRAPKGATAPTRDTVWPALIDRIVARRLVEELEPHAVGQDAGRAFPSRQFPPSSLPRGNYETWFERWRTFRRAQADAAASSGLSVSFKTDVADFFPSVGLDLARSAIARETRAHPDLLDLVFECLEAWRPRIGYHKQRGLPQDPVGLSGLAAHCVLRPVDEAFTDRYDRRYLRFVDDTVVFVPDQAAAKTAQRDHSRALARLGLKPNAEKTRTTETADLLEELSEKPYAAIDEAARLKDRRPLRALVKRWRHDDRVRRRLYGVLSRLGESMLDDALAEDLRAPKMRARALQYWRSRPLDAQRWATFRATWRPAPRSQASADASTLDEATADGAGLTLLASHLANAPLADPELADEIAAWCRAELQRGVSDPPGHGIAHGWLLLTLFRLDPTGARAYCETARAAGARQLSTPLSQFIDLIGLSSTGSWTPEPVDPWSDHGLSLWLLADARSGRLRDPVRLIKRLLNRAQPLSAIPAEALPLLHAIDHGLRRADVPDLREALRAMLMRRWEAHPHDLPRHIHGRLFALEEPR